MGLRALIVGVGSRGQEWAATVDAHPDWVLGGVADPDGDAVESVVGNRSAPLPAAPDLRGLLEQVPDADAVIVATPPDGHVEPASTALDHRCAVLVEKPFTLRLEEAQRLTEQAESAGIPLLVAQNYRYQRAHRTARSVVQSGRLGRIGLVTGHYYRPPHSMAASLAALPDRAMWGAAIHHLDALRFVLGQRVAGVFCRSSTQPWNDPPAGASLQIVLEFDGGTRALYGATYESSGHEYFERGQEFYERFVGERATLHVQQRWLFLSQGRRPPLPVRRGRRDRTEEAVLLDQLAVAIVAGSDAGAECSGRDNLETMAVVEACRRSADEDRWIDPRELLE